MTDTTIVAQAWGIICTMYPPTDGGNGVALEFWSTPTGQAIIAALQAQGISADLSAADDAQELTSHQAAALARCDHSTIGKAIRLGHIPVVRHIGSKRYVAAGDVRRWMAGLWKPSQGDKRTAAFSPAAMMTLQAAAGLNNRELASQVGVSIGAVANWRTGINTPGAENVQALAAALGCTVEALLAANASEDGTDQH